MAQLVVPRIGYVLTVCTIHTMPCATRAGETGNREFQQNGRQSYFKTFQLTCRKQSVALEFAPDVCINRDRLSFTGLMCRHVPTAPHQDSAQARRPWTTYSLLLVLAMHRAPFVNKAVTPVA
jgi:hypothetical protein